MPCTQSGTGNVSAGGGAARALGYRSALKILPVARTATGWRLTERASLVFLSRFAANVRTPSPARRRRPSCLYQLLAVVADWQAPRSARKSKTAPLYVHVLEQFWLPVTLFIPLLGEGVAISQASVYLESTHLLI